MTKMQIIELVKLAYLPFPDLKINPDLYESWAETLMPYDFDRGKKALEYILAEGPRRPPNAAQIKKALSDTVGARQDFMTMTDQQMRELYIAQGKLGLVPVFERAFPPSIPHDTYRYSRMDSVMDTGKKIKVWGIVIPEYRPRVY